MEKLNLDNPSTMTFPACREIKILLLKMMFKIRWGIDSDVIFRSLADLPDTRDVTWGSFDIIVANVQIVRKMCDTNGWPLHESIQALGMKNHDVFERLTMVELEEAIEKMKAQKLIDYHHLTRKFDGLDDEILQLKKRYDMDTVEMIDMLTNIQDHWVPCEKSTDVLKSKINDQWAKRLAESKALWDLHLEIVDSTEKGILTYELEVEITKKCEKLCAAADHKPVVDHDGKAVQSEHVEDVKSVSVKEASGPSELPDLKIATMKEREAEITRLDRELAIIKVKRDIKISKMEYSILIMKKQKELDFLRERYASDYPGHVFSGY